MLKIIVDYDKETIVKADISVQGVEGQACLLSTDRITSSNPDALMQETEDMYAVPEEERTSHISG